MHISSLLSGDKAADQLSRKYLGKRPPVRGARASRGGGVGDAGDDDLSLLDKARRARAEAEAAKSIRAGAVQVALAAAAIARMEAASQRAREAQHARLLLERTHRKEFVRPGPNEARAQRLAFVLEMRHAPQPRHKAAHHTQVLTVFANTYGALSCSLAAHSSIA